MFAPHRDVAFEQVANAELSTNGGCVDILPLVAARGPARDHAELAEPGQHVVEVVSHPIRDQGARLLATTHERQDGNRDEPAFPPQRRSGPCRRLHSREHAAGYGQTSEDTGCDRARCALRPERWLCRRCSKLDLDRLITRFGCGLLCVIRLRPRPAAKLFEQGERGGLGLRIEFPLQQRYERLAARQRCVGAAGAGFERQQSTMPVLLCWIDGDQPLERRDGAFAITGGIELLSKLDEYAGRGCVEL